MELTINNIVVEFYFGPIQPIEIPVNSLFGDGKYVVESVDGSSNAQRDGVITNNEKTSIIYIPNNDNGFWDDHLSTDTVTFTVKGGHCQEKTEVSVTLVRYLNPEDYFPGAATLNLPENVGPHIRLELEQFFKYAPFELVKVIFFDKRIFRETMITGEDKTDLDLFLNTDYSCYPDYSEMYLLTRHPETGQEAFTVIFIVWSKATFYAMPQVVYLSNPMPVYVLSPVVVNSGQSFTITGVSDDAPLRGLVEAAGDAIKYTFNLESGYWDEVGASDLVGAGVTNNTGLYSGNNHKFIKTAASDVNATITASQSYTIYAASLLIEEELTPDGTYTAPYKVRGTLEIRKGNYNIGVPFEGVLDLADPYTLVPDTYSDANFSHDTLFGGIAIVSGTLTGLTGTIEEDETITFTGGTANT